MRPTVSDPEWSVRAGGFVAVGEPGPASQPVRFRVLGPLELVGDTGHVGHLPQAKWRALLALLLVNTNRAVSVGEAQRQLWPGEPPRSGVKLVQNYVHRLRGVLGDPRGERLQTRPPGYRLRVADGELDVDRFTELTGRGHRALAAGRLDEAAALMQSALAQWRGPALADATDVPAVHAEAIRLDECRLAATETWLHIQLTRGNHHAVIPALRALVTAYPLRERFAHQLMTALYHEGRSADALTVSRRLRHTLDRELALRPSPAVAALEVTILRGDQTQELPYDLSLRS